MKILLINTSFKDIFGYERLFPLGLGYIASVLINAGNEVTLLEPQIDNISDTQLEEWIIKNKPELIGLTAVTTTFPEAVRIAGLIKNKNKGLKIVIGGVHVSCFPEKILNECSNLDFVVEGEGEQTMLELCAGLKEAPGSLKGIKGLYYRENGKVVSAEKRPYITDLENIPLPARQLSDMSKYNLPLHISKGKKSATMITSRGCPARCIFCSSKITMGDLFRAHSPEYVLREIEELIGRYGIKHIQFVDDTFTISAERAKKICQEIIRRNIKFEWHCFARVETVSEELLRDMKKAGCTSILFGIESGDEKILRNIKKGINLAKAKEAHRLCRKIGIKILSSFIIGNPGETIETANKTINFARQLKPTYAMFYRLVPYPGSEAYRIYNDMGRMKQDLGWGSFAPKGTEVVFEHENLSQKDLDSLIVKAYRSFYLNPGNLLRIALSLNTWSQIRISVFAAWATFRQAVKWKSQKG